MNAPRRLTVLASGLVCAGVIAAGCGSKPAASTTHAPAQSPPPLATSSAVTTGAAWTVVQMGGPAAQHENFWELFVRPAGTARWRLATPAGVADNGGLVVTAAGGSLLTGFRPSQDLTFSPLAASSDSGASWSPAGPLTPGLAAAPDALAVTAAGQVIALTKGGGVQFGSRSGTSWTHLGSVKTVARTAAGRACGPTGLTAAAFSSAGVPMLAASCSRPGAVGIFGDTGSGWSPAGPARATVLASTGLSGQDIEVVRLAAAGTGVTALLRAGSGRNISLVAAWSHGINSPWTLSAPLRVGRAPADLDRHRPGRVHRGGPGRHQGRDPGRPGSIVAGAARPAAVDGHARARAWRAGRRDRRPPPRVLGLPADAGHGKLSHGGLEPGADDQGRHSLRIVGVSGS